MVKLLVLDSLPFRAFYRGTSEIPGLSPWAKGVALSGLLVGNQKIIGKLVGQEYFCASNRFDTHSFLIFQFNPLWDKPLYEIMCILCLAQSIANHF